MPRYLIERAIDDLTEAELHELTLRSKQLLDERFEDITWEHSHVVADDQGRVTTYCIYDAPSEERIREHAGSLGQHLVREVREVIGDIEPSTLSAA